MSDKIPIIVELIGEPESGKTHLASSFPNPCIIDTTDKGEAKAIVMDLYNDWRERYNLVSSFNEIRTAVGVANKQGRKTIVFDTSKGLDILAMKEYVKEEGHQPYPPTEWGKVRRRIDDMLFFISAKCSMNIVLTSPLTDEYKNTGMVDRKGYPIQMKSGRRKRDGYPKLDFQADIRLLLKVIEKEDKWVRQAIVFKNRFCDKISDSYIHKMNGDSVSYNGIKKLVLLKKCIVEDMLVG